MFWGAIGALIGAAVGAGVGGATDLGLGVGAPAGVVVGTIAAVFARWLRRVKASKRAPLHPTQRSIDTIRGMVFDLYAPGQHAPLLGDFVPRNASDGRDLVEEARSHLNKDPRLILHGDGGGGKSTLAYQAAAWFAHEKQIGFAWVSAAGRDGLTTDDFAGLLADGLGCEAAIGPVCARLRTGPYLLVLDNVDSADPGLPRALAAVFPGNCWLLLTTRVADERLRDLATSMPLGTMRPDEAQRYTREEAARQSVTVAPGSLESIVGIAKQDPTVIRWLVGQAAVGRLDLATQEVEAGRGEAADQVFRRTWDSLTLPERTALCALAFVSSGTRESVADATADRSADQTLGRLRQWAVATHDAGDWSVTGLTRSMA